MIIKPTKDQAIAFFQGQQAASGLGISADFEKRKIFLIGEVDDVIANKFIVVLQFMDKNPAPITVILSSTGGGEPQGYAIYDAIRICKSPVCIDGLGAVQSIAALILQAGTLRRLSPECRFMIHNGSVSLGNDTNADELVSIGEEVRKSNQRYHAVLALRSGMPIAEIKSLCEAETYFSASEAVKSGFADEVIEIPKKKKFPAKIKKRRNK